MKPGRFLLSLVLVLAAAAQDHSRAVSGTVTDKAGNSLPNAAVELENKVTLQIQSAITDHEGHYHFSNLNPDVEFTLIAKYKSYWSKKTTISKFNEQRAPVVNLVIPIE